MNKLGLKCVQVVETSVVAPDVANKLSENIKACESSYGETTNREHSPI